MWSHGIKQPPRDKLQPVARSGGVPRPLRELHVAGDLTGLGPRLAVVVAAGHPDGSRRLTGADQALGTVGIVAAEQQPDATR